MFFASVSYSTSPKFNINAWFCLSPGVCEDPRGVGGGAAQGRGCQGHQGHGHERHLLALPLHIHRSLFQLSASIDTFLLFRRYCSRHRLSADRYRGSFSCFFPYFIFVESKHYRTIFGLYNLLNLSIAFLLPRPFFIRVLSACPSGADHASEAEAMRRSECGC